MNKQRGFTLIELLIVMGILAILAAFAAPSMTQWRDSARIKGVASDILSGLRQARSAAITENQNVTATINLGTHRLTLVRADGTVLPERIFANNIKLQATYVIETDWVETDWVDTGSKLTTFLPQGSCSNILFIRVNEDPSLIIKIDSTASGLARL